MRRRRSPCSGRSILASAPAAQQRLAERSKAWSSRPVRPTGSAAARLYPRGGERGAAPLPAAFVMVPRPSAPISWRNRNPARLPGADRALGAASPPQALGESQFLDPARFLDSTTPPPRSTYCPSASAPGLRRGAIRDGRGGADPGDDHPALPHHPRRSRASPARRGGHDPAGSRGDVSVGDKVSPLTISFRHARGRGIQGDRRVPWP